MLVCELEKNMREKIRVSLEYYRGTIFVDLRVYWQDEQGEWRPSKKGIALSGACIGQVVEALGKASAKLEEVEINEALCKADKLRA